MAELFGLLVEARPVDEAWPDWELPDPTQSCDRQECEGDDDVMDDGLID